MNVPSFSRNEVPGRKTCANFEEQVLYDDALHAAERGLNMLRVRVRLGEILALDVHALVVTGNCGIEHIGNTVSRLRVELDGHVGRD